MPVCELQYLSNLHGDHLRLYLRNTQEFHLQTCSQSPRHNGDIARFRLLALGTLASFDLVKRATALRRRVWPARRQCRAAWAAPLFLVGKELKKIVSHRTASFGIPQGLTLYPVDEVDTVGGREALDDILARMSPSAIGEDGERHFSRLLGRLRLERLRRRTMTCCVLQQYSGIADLYLVRALAEIATNIIDSCSLVGLAT